MARDVETHIYLVRHGETDWNREGRLQGALDVPLNSAGMGQAKRLADAFARSRIACIITSPQVRASATAAILAEACACPVTTDTRLREIDHGVWSGRTLRELAQNCPSLVGDESFAVDALDDASRGEPLSAVHCRASAALDDLLNTYHGESVVVVGHGVTLAAMWCAAKGLDIARFQECPLPNAGVVVLTFSQRQLAEARPLALAETLA